MHVEFYSDMDHYQTHTINVILSKFHMFGFVKKVDYKPELILNYTKISY